MKLFNGLALSLMALLIGVSACHPHHQTNPGASTAQFEQTQGPMMDDQAGQNPDRQQMMQQMCPMQVEGTTRELVKLDDGVAMDFTTTGDVDELRKRVQAMAERREQMHGEGGMMHGRQGGQGGQGQMHGEGGMMHGQQGGQGQMHGRQDGQGQMHGGMTDEQRQMRQQMKEIMSDATIETEEIDHGMRVVVTPNDAGQVDRLYEMMANHSRMMEESGRCPMM